MIWVKRVYDPPSARDGKRFLVDRLCPRGVKRDAHRRAQLVAVAAGVAGAAVVVIATGVWEEFIIEATEADAALLQTNHTIILFGLIQLLKFAPHLFISLEVIGDAGRAGPGTPD